MIIKLILLLNSIKVYDIIIIINSFTTTVVCSLRYHNLSMVPTYSC